MDKLPENIREFLQRDLVFLSGGALVLVTFAQTHCSVDPYDIVDGRNGYFWLGLALSYVVGYALQEFASFIRIQTTQDVPGWKEYKKENKESNRWHWWLWPWAWGIGVGSLSHMTTAQEFIRRATTSPDGLQYGRRSLDRIAAHRMISTVFSPCLALVGITLLRHEPWNAVISFALSIALWIVGWVKGRQDTVYQERWRDVRGDDQPEDDPEIHPEVD